MSEALDALQKTVAEACALIDRLQAENKKLREGLASIAVKAGTSECDGDYTIACFVIGEIEHLADAALRGEDKE